jgi:endonuclease III related protein
MKDLKAKLIAVYKRLLDHFGFQNWWPGETPFEVMIGAILTQNTAWANVEKALDNVKKKGLLVPGRLLTVPEKELALLIRPSGYFNQKAKKVKEFLRFFDEKYSLDLEKMKKVKTMPLRAFLLGVKGIGRETADSMLLYAASKRIFVIDAYTRRIFYRLGFLNKEEIEYDEVRELFEKNIPRSLKIYKDFHAQIVMLGKNYCRKRDPLCGECPVAGLCRFNR